MELGISNFQTNPIELAKKTSKPTNTACSPPYCSGCMAHLPSADTSAAVAWSVASSRTHPGSICESLGRPAVHWVPGYPTVRQTHVWINTCVPNSSKFTAVSWLTKRKTPHRQNRSCAFQLYVISCYILLADEDDLLHWVCDIHRNYLACSLHSAMSSKMRDSMPPPTPGPPGKVPARENIKCQGRGCRAAAYPKRLEMFPPNSWGQGPDLGTYWAGSQGP